MNFPRILLWINSVFFVVFGLSFMFAPSSSAELLIGSIPASPSAMIDMRATYGGFGLGIGVFFGVCARNMDLVLVGLGSSLAILSGIVLGRIVGILLDGEPNNSVYAGLFSEILFLVLTVFAIRVQTNANDKKGRKTV